MTMTGRNWLLLGFLSLIWGGSFFFAAVALAEVPPLTLVFCRVFLAALALFVVLKLRGRSLPRQLSIYGAFLVVGLVNNVIPFSLIFWAQTTIPSGLASILNATTPIFTIVVAHFALADERLSRGKLVGVLLGVIGVVILLGKDLLGGFDAGTIGVVACLGAALSYGVASIFGRRFRAMGIGVTTVAWGQLSASSLIMLPIVLLVDQPWLLGQPSTASIASIVLLALVSTSLAYLIFFHLIATAGAVNTSLVTLVVPVSAVLLGTLFLGERLAPSQFIGMFCIGLGLLAIDGRVFRRENR